MAHDPSIQFLGLIVLAFRERQRQSVYTPLQPRKARLRLRLQISEHLPITGFDLGDDFIGSRKHSPNKLDNLADLSPQLLYVPLALCAATFEIAHWPPIMLLRP
jgi:hypothetical protein